MGPVPHDLLLGVIQQLQFRREQSTHEARRGLLAAQPEQTTGLNSVTRELLLKSQQFHSKRAVK